MCPFTLVYCREVPSKFFCFFCEGPYKVHKVLYDVLCKIPLPHTIVPHTIVPHTILMPTFMVAEQCTVKRMLNILTMNTVLITLLLYNYLSLATTNRTSTFPCPHSNSHLLIPTFHIPHPHSNNRTPSLPQVCSHAHLLAQYLEVHQVLDAPPVRSVPGLGRRFTEEYSNINTQYPKPTSPSA